MKKLVGGQAVIEGVMMKSDDCYAVSVRKPNGKIKTLRKKLNPITKRIKILGWPFVRGTVVLIETLVLGLDALSYSAKEADEEEQLSKFALTLTILSSLLIAIALFILVPLYLTKLVVADRGFLFNVIDGMFRLGIFFAYLFGISAMKDVRKVFQYHGAEHMAVNCYEDNKDVTVQNAMKYSTLHPRCGTAFLIIVLVISIFVFSLIISPNMLVKFGGRIVLLPVIAGISYELLKFTSRFRKNPIIKLVMQPGLLVQRITTRKPDEKQVEVAVTALKAVLK